jgi:DNA polymerase-3 subunit delta
VTADALAARSALRKLFEDDRRLVSLQFFADMPEPADIEEALRDAGLTAGITPDARDALVSIGSGMDHGSFRQLIGLVALHGLGSDKQLDLQSIEALAPAGLDGDIDQLLDAVAGGAANRIGAILRRLSAGGVAPVTLLIALQRHFRMLLTAASADGGPSAGLAAIRPPLWGPRRSAAQAQLSQWGHGRLEQASRLLFETDAKVRSSQQAPDLALVERCALRLALMAGR